LNLEAVDLYFSLEYIPAPYSIFKGIHKLKPGCYLSYKDSQVKIISFWDLENYSKSTQRITFNEAAEKLEYLLRRSVKEHLSADAPLGVFLSGGLDSSALVALASQNLPGKCDTFSMGFTEYSYDETKYAQRVSNYFATRHHHYRFTLQDFTGIFPKVNFGLDEPLGDLSVFPTYLLSKFSRQSVKTVLSGEGTDELFMGYPTYLAHKYMDSPKQIPSRLQKFFLNMLGACLPVSFKPFSLNFKVRQLLRGGFLQNPSLRHLLWMGSFLPSEKPLLYNESLKNYWARKTPQDYCESLFRDKVINDDLKKIQYLDIFSYLSEDLLVKADRATMMASLEARVPYLDHKLVEFIWSLPPEFIFQKRLLKFVMKKYLPAGIIRRPKKGFGIPFAQWLEKKEFFDLAEIFFTGDFIKKQNLFNYKYIKQILNEHLMHKNNNQKKLGTYIMFQAWYQNNYHL
jgi:asparagine synthase (glutamine-hydrolysing)